MGHSPSSCNDQILQGVCVCVALFLEKSINDLQKHSFASFCSSCENCAHCFASFPKPSELTSPSPFFISISLEKRNSAQRLELMEAPPVEKIQTLSKELLLGDV